jgi:hypothetical protein
MVCGPVKPVRTMGIAAGGEKFSQGRQGIILVPLGIALGSSVPACFINSQGRVNSKIKRYQLITYRIPLVRARFYGLTPQLTGSTKTVLFVLVIVISRIILNSLAAKQRFR